MTKRKPAKQNVDPNAVEIVHGRDSLGNRVIVSATMGGGPATLHRVPKITGAPASWYGGMLDTPSRLLEECRRIQRYFSPASREDFLDLPEMMLAEAVTVLSELWASMEMIGGAPQRPECLHSAHRLIQREEMRNQRHRHPAEFITEAKFLDAVAIVAEWCRGNESAEAEIWSEWKSPSGWRNDARLMRQNQAISQETLLRMIERGELRERPGGTSRRKAFRLDDLAKAKAGYEVRTKSTRSPH